MTNKIIDLPKTAKILAMAAIATCIATYSANARPDVRSMTCSQATSMVNQNGSVVFTLTSRTYEKIVKNRQFCESAGEDVKSVFARTSDSLICKIGNRCIKTGGEREPGEPNERGYEPADVPGPETPDISIESGS